MAQQDWETIKRAVEDLNSGNTETALALCTDEVVVHVGHSENNPAGVAYRSRDSIRKLWHETVDSIGEQLEVKPLRMLSDGRHLVLFVEAILGAGPDRRTKRVVVTGTAEPDAPWSELWAESDDRPVSEVEAFQA